VSGLVLVDIARRLKPLVNEVVLTKRCVVEFLSPFLMSVYSGK